MILTKSLMGSAKWLLLLLFAVFCVFACTKGEPEKSASRASVTVDSPEARLQAAQKVLDAYPAEQFVQYLNREVAAIVGSEVLEEARLRLRQQMTARQILLKRKEILVETFTAAELEKLAGLMVEPEGRAIFEKLTVHNERWRDFLSPFLLEALSGGS